jgi:hypothetical protein
MDDQEAADRRALEAVLGRCLDGEPWPDDAMQPGTRVRVTHDLEWSGPWREVCLGAIDATVPPQLVHNPVAQPGEREYSVTFDAPHFDAGGDGPYRKAVIWERYLEHL